MKKIIRTFSSLTLIFAIFFNLLSTSSAFSGVSPTLLSPKPNSTLKSDSSTLKWSNEGATCYNIAVGTKYVGSPDLAWIGCTKKTSAILKNLPTNGQKIYVRLFSVYGSNYTAAKDFTLISYVKKQKQTSPKSTSSAPKSKATTTPPSSPTSAPITSPDPIPTVIPTPSSPSPTPLTTNGSQLSAIWANDGGDKITRDEHRASTSPDSVKNSTWDGTKISTFGAKNEVVDFNLILESTKGAKNLSINFNKLIGPNGATISSDPTADTTTNLFNWTNRDIELFYVQYLQIKGLSRLSYETYDERHIPEDLQRPYTGEGYGTGTWNDRPNHDKYYPDIAVPLELKPTFDISANENQSIWTDIYIPKDATPGLYKGNVIISENSTITQSIPVELTVRNFSLPETPSSKTMVNFSRENINNRFLGQKYTDPGTSADTQSQNIRDQFFKLAHRHKISLVEGDGGANDEPSAEWISRLNGNLFTAANGYRGPGENSGNNVYSIGQYGSWNWQNQGESPMRAHSDAWVNWFTKNAPGVEYFLYLIDESSNYPQIQQWANWIKNNPGPGKKLKSFATINLPDAIANTPSLDIVASWLTVGNTDTWQSAYDTLKTIAGKEFFAYNGKRPSNGSFATEDDGVALREIPWAQYKKGVDRWYFWESTYYNNYQGGQGETNVFQKAQTFGGAPSTDSSLGQSGWNYSNGDGVLFYPGTDKLFPSDSYGIDGPIASIRLKEWRRGIQDVDYITLAAAKNPIKVAQIVATMVPKALWDYGVTDQNDPTWVRSNISWSTNPDVWENARAQLADIIEN